MEVEYKIPLLSRNYYIYMLQTGDLREPSENTLLPFVTVFSYFSPSFFPVSRGVAAVLVGSKTISLRAPSNCKEVEWWCFAIQKMSVHYDMQHTVTWYDLMYKCQKLTGNFTSFIKKKTKQNKESVNQWSASSSFLPFNITGLNRQLT